MSQKCRNWYQNKATDEEIKGVSANTTVTFKRIDTFWHNGDIIYNFKAQLHETRSRSKVMYEKS